MVSARLVGIINFFHVSKVSNCQDNWILLTRSIEVDMTCSSLTDHSALAKTAIIVNCSYAHNDIV